MASKIILDSPEILEETLVSLTEACRCFPVRCSRPAIERWVRKGSRGVVLESALVCGKRFTSREAIDRFVRNQLQVAPDRPEPRKSTLSKKEIDQAVKHFRLLEPKSLASNCLT